MLMLVALWRCLCCGKSDHCLDLAPLLSKPLWEKKSHHLLIKVALPGGAALEYLHLTIMKETAVCMSFSSPLNKQSTLSCETISSPQEEEYARNLHPHKRSPMLEVNAAERSHTHAQERGLNVFPLRSSSASSRHGWISTDHKADLSVWIGKWKTEA